MRRLLQKKEVTSMARGKRGRGLRKARCVRTHMAKGSTKKSARRACGVKGY